MSASGNGPPKHNPKVPPGQDAGTPTGTSGRGSAGGAGTPGRERPPPADGAPRRGAGVPPPEGTSNGN